ncbi:MAG: hypothetical protein IPP40_15930 [bacterium]|nr:hypothetical protein [bacterium]
MYGEQDEIVKLRRRFDRVLRTDFTAEWTADWQREEQRGFDVKHKPISFFFFERAGTEAWAGRAVRRWGEFGAGLGYRDIRTGGVATDVRANLLWFDCVPHIDTPGPLSVSDARCDATQSIFVYSQINE